VFHGYNEEKNSSSAGKKIKKEFKKGKKRAKSVAIEAVEER